MSEIAFLLQSALATTLCNFKSDSRDGTNTTKRTEGWTEVWGDERGVVDKNEECWQAEAADSKRIIPNHTVADIVDAPTLTLVQYRPAWLEQMVLRIGGVPHVVVNSPYSSCECTGSLPYLKDVKPNTKLPYPIMVGRRQPKLRSKLAGIPGGDQKDEEKQNKTTTTAVVRDPDNDILNYLKTELNIDLDVPLANNKSLQARSITLRLLITTKLHHCMMVLRYEDRDAWEQVYKKQCFEGSRNGVSTTESTNDSYRRFPTMRGLFQAWSERLLARKQLWASSLSRSVDQAKLEAQSAYELLEQQLQERDNEQHYLLSTPQPTLVDALLWAHLAEALCDVHLVVLLADFPLLVQYFQHIHKTYFATTTPSNQSDWQVWNQYQNHCNAFLSTPLEITKTTFPTISSTDGEQFQGALKLMKSMSVQEENLLDVLQKAKAAREEQNGLVGNKKPQLRSEEPEKPSAVEIARREHERSDQYWVTIVGAAAVLVGIAVLQQE